MTGAGAKIHYSSGEETPPTVRVGGFLYAGALRTPPQVKTCGMLRVLTRRGKARSRSRAQYG